MDDTLANIFTFRQLLLSLFLFGTWIFFIYPFRRHILPPTLEIITRNFSVAPIITVGAHLFSLIAKNFENSTQDN